VAGVYPALDAFVLEHGPCGGLHGDTGPLTIEGYHVRAVCACGACFERWVTPDDAVADLLRSALGPIEN